MDFSGVTLASKVETPFKANQVSAEEEVQVKYELDTIQNLKKAKANLSRSKNFKRKVVDDMNIKFEIHPAVYLEIKEKITEVKQGLAFVDEELGIEVKVNKTRRTVTKKAKDIPENTIWSDVGYQVRLGNQVHSTFLPHHPDSASTGRKQHW